MPHRRNRGQSLVELALLLPLFVLLLAGLVELGRLSYTWVTLQHAARTGARFAVTGIGEDDGTRMKQIARTVREAALNLPADEVKVIVRSWHGPRHRQLLREGTAGGPCDLIEIEAQYHYRPVVPLIRSVLSRRITLRGADRKLNEPWAPCE